MTTTEHNLPGGKHPGGRPKGIVRRTCIVHGAYSKDLGDVLASWKKKQPGAAARVDEIITKYLRALGWTPEHEQYNEVRDLSIQTVSRGMFFMKILEMDYTRHLKDHTGVEIKERPCDQLTRLETLDTEIQARIVKLGLYPIINKKKEKQI